MTVFSPTNYHGVLKKKRYACSKIRNNFLIEFSTILCTRKAYIENIPEVPLELWELSQIRRRGYFRQCCCSCLSF